MRQFFFALIFLSTLPGYSQQTLGFSLPDGVNRIDIPIEIHNNLIVVPVILNNRLPLKFIIDTGVRTAILTQKVYSDILNLSYTRKYSLSGPGGQKLVDAFITSNVTFDMPGVHGQGHSMLVLQEDYLELKNSMGTDVHGILGYELFSRFVVMIDYEAKKMILMRPENFKPKKSYQALPIRIEDTKPFVELTISVRDSSQITAKFLVDTGASHGLLIEEDSDKRLRMPDKNISSILGRGIAGIITGKISRTKLLKFGKYELNDLITSFPDDYAYRDSVGSKNFTPRNGSVGGDLLSRFTVIFNFPGEMMYIKKNASFKKKFYYSLSGITLRAKGPKLREYEISDVRTNTTAAAAGLKVGDVIVSVNGVRVSDYELSYVNNFFNSKPGRKIKVEILRNGEKMKKEFILENQI
ncbi:MAG: aspartyl protease family protein [Cyclobacteriaceae bacterium]|nr:aspartyl protease family protein [Flammeovirgaceae bacterium]